MPGSGEIYRRDDGKWSFLVKTESGEPVATDAGEGHPAKAAARAVAQQLMRGDFDGPILEEPTLMCGQEITEDTTLEDDLVCTSGPGLIVAADNITVDLGGHTISGTSGTSGEPGILLRNVNGVTVQNGTVQRFGAGVVILEGSKNTVRNITAQDNIGSVSGELGDGINALNSSDNLIQGNNVLRNGPFSGISLVERCQGNMVRGNIVSDNNMLHTGSPTDGRQAMGIRVEGPEANDNQVIDNTVTGSGAEGISLHATCTTMDATPQCAGSPPNQNNEVARNTSNNNGTSGAGSGIKLFSTPNAVAPTGNTITDNVTDNNATNGISVDSGGPNVGATENTIARNKAHGNRRYDAADGNVGRPCDANVWQDNEFGTVNQACVRGTVTPGPGPGPGGPPAGETSIGPISLQIDNPGGAESMVHVTYDINFSERDVQTHQVYAEECRLIGDDTGTGDPPAAGDDDTLGFFTPLFSNNTTPEGSSRTLSRHFMKTFRRSELDEDRFSIPNPDEIRALVTLTPTARPTGNPIRRESDVVNLNIGQ